MIAGGWGRGKWGLMFNGAELQNGVMTQFWGGTVVMAEQQCGRTEPYAGWGQCGLTVVHSENNTRVNSVFLHSQL